MRWSLIENEIEIQEKVIAIGDLVESLIDLMPPDGSVANLMLYQACDAMGKFCQFMKLESIKNGGSEN
jgi:hypothetical protein